MNAVFTIATSDYISYAKTLGDSISIHNTAYKFFICLIGEKKDLPSYVDTKTYTIIEIQELDDERVMSMQAQYNMFELSCALKPYFADHILKIHESINRLKYLDCDIFVFSPFDRELDNNGSSIFITPHFTKAVDLTEASTNDGLMLKLGLYNAGYFEVANDLNANQFLNWWKDRLAKYCFNCKMPNEYIFVDQSWLTLVPIYFEGVQIVNHPGYNISFFNLQEREMSKIGEQFLVNKSWPLVFFHYTGYKYYNHDKASVHHPNYNYTNTSYLEEVCTKYRKALIENCIEQTSPPPPDVPVKNLRPSISQRVKNKIKSSLLTFLEIESIAGK